MPCHPCQVWDLGGQTSIRPYWRCYYPNTDAIVFVVDSCDVDRLGVARQELMAMLEEDELKDSILLVFANKQDSRGALNAQQVTRARHSASVDALKAGHAAGVRGVRTARHQESAVVHPRDVGS